MHAAPPGEFACAAPHRQRMRQSAKSLGELLSLSLLCVALTARAAADGNFVGATLLAIKGRVEISRSGASAWDPAQTNAVLQPGDRLQTREHSRATLRLRDATIVPVDELTTLKVESEGSNTIIELIRASFPFSTGIRPGRSRCGGPAPPPSSEALNSPSPSIPTDFSHSPCSTVRWTSPTDMGTSSHSAAIRSPPQQMPHPADPRASPAPKSRRSSGPFTTRPCWTPRMSPSPRVPPSVGSPY